jgi:hypothetical protein
MLKVSLFSLLLFHALLLQKSLIIAEKDGNNVVSAVTRFCLDKERENFCSDQHLQMMINFAALQGKSRPIQNIKELEEERQKEIEKQRISKIEKEKKRQRLLEIKKETLKKLELDLKMKQERERLRKIEMETKILNHILKSLSGSESRKLLFRF